MPLRSKAFADVLNVVCIQKTNLTTKQTSYVLLFSNDLALEADKMIGYYALRFQIEFNFRDAKQYWGLADFMNTGQTQVTNALNLSLFMVNVTEKLMAPFRRQNPEFSVLDLKAHYRGAKYVAEVLKILPQEPELIVIQQLNEHIGTIGAIHQIQPRIDTG